MNRAFSVYLDLVRFAAACLVYLYHSNQRLLVREILPASNYGHSAVIVFFVLSGFVIAYVTDTKERHWVTYAASRISRIFSVAIPAIGLTLVLDAIGRQLYPALYGGYPFDLLVVRAGASLLLLNEVWFVSITSLSNVPYWSICYESWYYVAFALVAFAPRRTAWLVIAALALVLGPKLVLLAPIWAAGVVLYRWKALAKLSAPVSWALVVGSVVGIVFFHRFDVPGIASQHLKGWIGAEWQKQLTFSQYFLSDYLLGILVLCNFAGMRAVASSLGRPLLAVERPVRFVAGFTLSLYLLHQPLFLFWAAVVQGDPDGIGYWVAVTTLTALSVLLIGHFTESKRHRLKGWVHERLQRLQAARSTGRYVIGG